MTLPVTDTARRLRTRRLDVAATAFAIVATALLLVALAVARESLAAASSKNAPPPSAYRELKWDELVPKDWDPMQGFRLRGLGALRDTDPRAAEAMKQLRTEWDNAPTVKTLDGAAVKLPGYVVPLDEVKGELREFLLVPYFGACIHTPPPPANQIVFVQPKGGAAKGFRAMDTVWVSGTLRASKADSAMGASGYRLDDALVERYVAPAPAR